MDDMLDEVCRNCGLNQGAHNGSDYYSEHYKLHIPYNYCPGHQGRMDWGSGPGTVFQPSGKFQHIEYGTPANRQSS